MAALRDEIVIVHNKQEEVARIRRIERWIVIAPTASAIIGGEDG
jgi:hypothetical protein